MSAGPLDRGSTGGERAAALADVVRAAAAAGLDPSAVLDIAVQRCTAILGGVAEVRLAAQDEAGGLPPATANADRIAVPLRSRGRVLGTLALTRDPAGRPYTAADGAFVAELADLVALLYDNARLYRRVLVHATILDQVAAAVVAVDHRGRVTAWNPAATRLFGWTAAEALGRDATGLISAEPEDRFAHARDIVLETGAYAGEWRLRRRRGPPFAAHLRLAGARDERGRVIGMVGVFDDLTERERAIDEVRRRGLHDPLTELPNRALVLDRLAHALATDDRRPGGVALLFLDVDHFKVVNDSLGHRAGDELLRAVADRLRAAVRPADTVGRFGGDEFVVLCEDVPDERLGLAIAERLAGVFAEPFRIAGDDHQIGASIGLALRSPGQDADALLRDADAAMYRAKERGRGRVELFDTGMRARAAGRLQTETALRRAVDGGELEVHYQPIVDLAGRSLVAFEALVRWRRPGHGLLGPDEFLEVAEESGLVVALGRRVLEQACGAALARGVPVHVNLSPRQLLDRALAETFEATLAATGADPRSIVFEITEGGVHERGPGHARRLERLRELGARVLLDRFGTGPSSLAHLAQLPLDGLKIDRSLTAGLHGGSAPVADAVVRLAAALELDVIAVGIEDEEQLAALRALGCRLGQGFLLGPPAPP